MPKSAAILLAATLALALVQASAQLTPKTGALEISGRVKIEGKVEKLTRKRFFIFKGGLKDNEALVNRLKSVEFESRDCYYSRTKASPEFVCWLGSENCESPYCRKIVKSDVDLVPEFKTAFQKGLLLYGKKEDVALGWLVTNLDRNLTSGFYGQQLLTAAKVTDGFAAVQSSMTDSVTVKAQFIDIPVAPADNKKTSTYTVSNVIPIVVGKKSYSWACEVEIGSDKTAVLTLKLPEGDKPVKGCEIVIRDLKNCSKGECKANK